MKRSIALLLVICLLAPLLNTATADGMLEAPAKAVLDIPLDMDVEADIGAVELSLLEMDGVEIDDLPLGEDETTSMDGSEEDEGSAEVILETGETEETGEAVRTEANQGGVPAKLKLGVKEKYVLDTKKLAKGKTVTYKSSKEAVVTVSKKGVITAVKAGSATVTCYSGKKKLASCKITVVKAPTKVSFGAKTVTIGVKESLALVPVVAKNTHASYTWTVKNKKIATVTKDGVVKGVKTGKTTVTVKTHNGKKASMTVKVVKAPTRVSFDVKTITLGVKESLALTPTLPKNTHASYTWTVKNKKIATVTKDGVVKGVKTGKTTVTVKTHNGKKATLKLVVKKAPGKLTLDRNVMELGLGQSGALRVTLPSGTASQITWKSSKPKVATVDENGVVTAVSVGTAKITANTFNKKKATCTVKVGRMIGPDSPRKDIKMVQKLLNKLGLLPKSGVTGIYDLATENAVSAFQLWAMKEGGYAGIGLTGIVDPATLSAMKAAQKKGVELDDSMGENEIVIPYGQKRIASGELSLSGRVRIYIPETVTEIAEDAFAGAKSVTIYSPVDSYAQTFAVNHGIPWKSCGARYLEEQTDALLEELDELEKVNPEAFEMDLEPIPTDEITDSKVASVVNRVNDTLDELKESEAQMKADAQSAGDALEGVVKELNRFDVKLDNSKVAITAKGLSYSIYTKNLDKLGKDCQVVSMKTTKAEDAVLIEVISGGRRLWIQLKGSELRVLDKQQANAVCGAFVKQATKKALIRSNSIVDVIWNTVKSAVTQIDNFCGGFKQALTELVRTADQAVSDELKALMKNDDWLAWCRLEGLNPQEPEVQKIARTAYDKCLKNYRAALEWQACTRRMLAQFTGCAAVIAIVDIKKNVDDFGTLMEIKLHDHPTDLDTDEKYDIAKKMVTDINIAGPLLVMDTGLSLIEVVDTLGTFIGSLGAIAGGPLAVLGLAAKEIAIKAVKKSLKESLKWLAAQVVIDGTANALVASIKSKDAKLHEVTYGSVSGKVTDKDEQKPLSGVQVMCKDCDPVTTNTEGEYTLEKVPVGNAQISYSKKFYISVEATVRVKTKEQSSLDIELKRGIGTVTGKVYDKKTKEAVSGVTVSCKGCNSVTTNAEGAYTLKKVPAGNDEIKFAKAGYEDEILPTTVEIGAVATLNASLVKGVGTVAGTVYDKETQEPLEGVSVSCEDCVTVTTDANGKYTLEKVPAGEQKLRFVKKGYAVVNRTVTVNEGKETSLDAEMEKKTGAVEGTVYDKTTNAPLEGVTVSCENCDTVTTDANGRYTLEKVPVGEVKIEFTKDGYLSAQKTVNVEMDATASLDMTMSRDNIPIDEAHFPDPLFRKWVAVNCDDRSDEYPNGDGYLSRQEINKVKAIRLHKEYDSNDYDDVKSCDGICYFTNVEEIEIVAAHQLTSLDVEGLSKLEVLDCRYDNLASLNVSGCTALRKLYCGANPLMRLDVSGLTELQKLYCFDNQLTSLNVSGLTELEELLCGGNQLTSLNVSGLTELKRLECYENQLTSLNVSGCTSLAMLFCDTNQLTSINVTGLTELKELWCRWNQLTSLDVSGFTNMGRLICTSNPLKSLNASGCKSLYYLECNENPLTDVDISGCVMLSTLEILEPQELRTLNASGCTSLTRYNFNIGLGGENALERMDFSGCTSLEELSVSGTYKLKSLNVSGCTSLQNLGCSNNQLSSLDLSGCTSLQNLGCYNNQLPSLDLSGLTGLQMLSCGGNKLSSLDVSGLTGLTVLDCSENQLTSLDVRGLTSLTKLRCSNNRLGILNASGCTSLTELDCGDNPNIQVIR